MFLIPSLVSTQLQKAFANKFEFASFANFTLRILLANFLVGILPLLMIVVGIVLVLRSRRETPGKRYAGFALISVPLGICAYIIAGIVAAAIRGEGHFDSVPFGGYDVNHNRAIVISAITWMVLVFVALAGLWRRKHDRSEGERPSR